MAAAKMSSLRQAEKAFQVGKDRPCPSNLGCVDVVSQTLNFRVLFGHDAFVFRFDGLEFGLQFSYHVWQRITRPFYR